MKAHLLQALREQLEQWERLLAGLSAEQAAAALPGWDWSLKDELAHLMAWQQISNARLEAAARGGAPALPLWLAGLDPDSEETLDEVNARIKAVYRELSWAEVVEKWRGGFERLLEQAEGFSERDLLDSARYAWLGGYSLADVLIGTYDHHREHADPLRHLGLD